MEYHCPEKCSFLSLTEEEQNKSVKKGSHYCSLHKTALKHNGLHPRIEAVWCCMYSKPVGKK